MLEALGDIVRNVAIIILVTTFLDMLLPNTKMEPFIKVVMGLFVMLAILTPVIELLDSDMELTAWQLSLPTEERVDTVLAQGKELRSLQEIQALNEYRGRLGRQMEALVKLIPEIGDVKCSVSVEGTDKLGAIAKINKATFWITLHKENIKNTPIKIVEPVRIEISDNNENKKSEDQDAKIYKEIKEKVLNLIANYYSLEKKNLEVIFY